LAFFEKSSIDQQPSSYFTTFLGWLVAAITNSHLPRYLPLGSLLALGAFLQILPHLARVFHPPFALFALSFFVSGLGQAYQDSHANTFVSTVRAAHRWLGFIHAMYGAGLLVSPFVATSVAVKSSGKGGDGWTLFYLFPLGLSVANLVLVLIAFRDSMGLSIRSRENGEREQEEDSRNRSAMVEIKQMLKISDLWIICLFFFFYLGVGTTSGGKSPSPHFSFCSNDKSQVGSSNTSSTSDTAISRKSATSQRAHTAAPSSADSCSLNRLTDLAREGCCCFMRAYVLRCSWCFGLCRI
jgi:hypothetical protein